MQLSLEHGMHSFSYFQREQKPGQLIQETMETRYSELDELPLPRMSASILSSLAVRLVSILFKFSSNRWNRSSMTVSNLTTLVCKPATLFSRFPMRFRHSFMFDGSFMPSSQANAKQKKPPRNQSRRLFPQKTEHRSFLLRQNFVRPVQRKPLVLRQMLELFHRPLIARMPTIPNRRHRQRPIPQTPMLHVTVEKSHVGTARMPASQSKRVIRPRSNNTAAKRMRRPMLRPNKLTTLWMSRYFWILVSATVPALISIYLSWAGISFN